jgi:hypothetical protein
MTLEEYMRTHGGEYFLADSSTRISLDNLNAEFAEADIVVYVVGQDASGRCKYHLYWQTPHIHIVTHIDDVVLEKETVPVGVGAHA